MNIKKIGLCCLLAIGSISLAACGPKDETDNSSESGTTQKTTATITVTNGLGSGTFNIGSTQTIYCNSIEGKTFKEWQVNGQVVATLPTYTFVVQEDTNFVAVFTDNLINKVTVSVAGGSGAGRA